MGGPRTDDWAIRRRPLPKFGDMAEGRRLEAKTVQVRFSSEEGRVPGFL